MTYYDYNAKIYIAINHHSLMASTRKERTSQITEESKKLTELIKVGLNEMEWNRYVQK